MEDDLKISKVEYLSNRLFDPPQLLNFSQYILAFSFPDLNLE